jgi:aryl-alcohol dehydrogenase-like predicted oxidoreductase
VAPVETLQTRYNLIDRDARDELLPFAERHDIGVVVHSPLASGLLAGCMTRERIAGLPQGDWRVHDERFQGRALARNLALVDRLSEVAERHGTTPGAVAVACTLRNRAVDGALVGFRHPDEVDPLLDAAGLELDARDLAILEGWG